MFIKIFQCPQCQSKDVFTEKSANNTGLYCGDCGKYIKWLTKDEIRLVNRQMDFIKEYNIKKIKEEFY